MVILAVSDLHREVDWLLEALDHHQPDLLLCAGDWGDPGQLTDEQFAAILQRVLVLSVFGNHDDRDLLQRLRNRDGSPVLLNKGAVRSVQGVTIAGISGIWAKTKLGSRLNARWQAARQRNPALTLEEWLAGRPLPPYVTDDEVAAQAAALARRRVAILVTHACPLGWGDRTPRGRSGGQRSFREASQAIRPRLHLCGHLHRLQRADLADGRAVLNTGHGAAGEGWRITWRRTSWTAEPLPAVGSGNIPEQCGI